jgi:hypothetical protein
MHARMAIKATRSTSLSKKQDSSNGSLHAPPSFPEIKKPDKPGESEKKKKKRQQTQECQNKSLFVNCLIFFLFSVVVCALNALFLFSLSSHPHPMIPTELSLSLSSPRKRLGLNLDLRCDLGLGVCDLDTDLLGAGDDVDSLSG